MIAEKWKEIPMAMKWTATAVTAIMGVIAYLQLFQSDAEAGEAHQTILEQVQIQGKALEQLSKESRVDRMKQEIFKWELRIDNLDISKPEDKKLYDTYNRRISELNATIQCIREDNC